jgi:hypothetical protein
MDLRRELGRGAPGERSSGGARERLGFGGRKSAR